MSDSRLGLPCGVVTLGLALLIAVTAAAPAGTAEPPTPVRLDRLAELDALAQSLAVQTDPRVAGVLPSIEGVGARLLALRAYLRSGEHLGQRWSWTQQQIAAYEGSAEQLELNAEIQLVRERFVAANPGYELFVNPQVRSLDVQLVSWNRNESVAAAGSRLLLDAIDQLASHADITATAREASLGAFLQAYKPEPTPTVAAPGLSPHGQMRAIDFQVHQGSAIIAGPDTRTIEVAWAQAGWAARLDAAVRAASSKFIGPLASPAEPWHYTYTPVAVADQ